MRSLLPLAVLLVGCGGSISPLSTVLDFGTVYLPGPYEGSTPVLNESGGELTLTAVETGSADFLYIGPLPLVMDAAAEYPLDFRFVAPADGFGSFTSEATATILPKRGDAYTMAITLQATFTDGDLDRDGFVGAAWGGDDCDDANEDTYPGATEICDGEDNDCDTEIGSGEIDQDGDGFGGCDDCDDTDADRRPGALEGCDGVDTDCDGQLGTDERDGDNDLYTACNGDCGPTDPAVHPGAVEQCDGLDNDCSDDGDPPASEADADSDGYALCEGDCDDTTPAIRPGLGELCDGADTNCDNVLPLDEADADGDGQAACQGDCDDNEDQRFQGNPELCDGIDNDCDGTPDADPLHEVDVDGDGSRSCADCDDGDPLAAPGNLEACDGVDTDCDPTTTLGSELDGDGDGSRACDDCDDADASNFPGNPELCDGQDNDCDAATGDDSDSDGDGVTACQGDCDDAEPAAFPSNPEICDGIDNDCDGVLTGEADVDLDGAPACVDCDDADGANAPGNPEVCDGQDNDCDGSTAASPSEDDLDGDGAFSCEDCADNDAARFPGNPEICDGLDNDCDAATTVSPGEMDLDEDGSPICGDCDDGDPYSFPGNPEICDLADNDCDPTTVETADVDGDGDSLCDGDCDDGSAAVGPGLAETCDGLDNDCDGALARGEDGDGDGDGTLDCADSSCPFWVDDGAGGTPTGASSAPYPTLQGGLDAAHTAGCGTVWVAPGTYGAFALPAREWRVEATGSGVILDAAGGGPLLTVDGPQTVATVLRGLTFRNGTVLGAGGAIVLDGAGLTLADCVLEDNAATGDGGALWSDGGDLVITGSTLRRNTSAGSGGGVYAVGGSLTLVDTLLQDNEGGGGDGGGLFYQAETGDSLTIDGAVFEDNVAFDDGGGAYLQGVSGLLQQTEFVGNSCNGTDAGRGGGVYITETTGPFRVRNNVFVANIGGWGSAIFAVSAAPFIDNNTIVDNAASGAAEPSTVRLFEGVFRNNIVAFNAGWGVDDAGSANFLYNDVHANAPLDWFDTDRDGINGNIDSNPLFTTFVADDLYNDDLTLQPNSPCLNTGHPGASFTEPDGSRSDMGAYGGPEGDW